MILPEDDDPPRSDKRDQIREQNEDAIVLEPEELDEAIIGISTDGSVIYSRAKLVEILMRDGGTLEEVEDHVCTNIEGSLIGQHFAPIIMVELEG